MATSVINFDNIARIYGNEFGYIEDIEDLIKFLKENEISQEEMNQILFCVLEKDNILEAKYSDPKKEKKSKVIVDETAQDSYEDSSFQDRTEIYDVNSYYSAINSCEESEMITEYLPSIYDSNFESIIDALLLKYRKDIGDNISLITASDDNDEIVAYCEDENKKNKQIISLIREYVIEEQQELNEDSKESLEKDKKEKRKLVFLQKPDGSYYVDDDLREIAEADKILQALQHIENNTIPRIKRFSSARLKGITVIRRQHTRIEFVELDKNTVAILGIYIKRFQNAKPYFEKLETRYKLFTEQAKRIKGLCSMDAYMDEQQAILGRVKDEIKSKERVGGVKYD